MKAFSMEAGMTNMRGVFYPTGHLVLMFPTEDDARHACHLLRQDGVSEDDLCLAAPQEFEQKITGACDDGDDLELPSAGTEAETAQHFRRLAHQGHYALIVHAKSNTPTEHILDVLKETPISYGQRYRWLVIEDVVEDRGEA